MTLWMESKGAKTSHQSSRRTCSASAKLHVASLLSSDQHTGTGRLFYCQYWVDLHAASQMSSDQHTGTGRLFYWVDLHAASLLSSDQHTGTGRLFYWVDLQTAHETRARLSKTEKNDMLLLCQYNGCFVVN